jgi:hypothetical protein
LRVLDATSQALDLSEYNTLNLMMNLSKVWPSSAPLIQRGIEFVKLIDLPNHD